MDNEAGQAWRSDDRTLCLAQRVRQSLRAEQSGLRGQWTGTTAQGKTVTFTISADENVTAITIVRDRA